MAKLNYEKLHRQERAEKVQMHKRAARKPRPIISWWWTPSRGGRCHECREPMPKGSRIAYSHTQQKAVCEICADSLGLTPSPSKAWMRQAK